MLIVAGGSGTDGVLSQGRIECGTRLLGQFIEQGLGPSLGGKDALHRGQREGAEADGTFQGGVDIITLIVGDQCQQLLRLQLAVDLLRQQAIEELHGHGAELLEALTQQQLTLVRIVGRVMVLECLPNALDVAG
jgi:hypothetical protein